jgi:hypothetical protein
LTTHFDWHRFGDRRNSGAATGLETNSMNASIQASVIEPAIIEFCGIDVAAPFDPERYFTMIRRTGGNPCLYRHGERVSYSLQFPGDILSMRRFNDVQAWAGAKDRGWTVQKAFLSAIVQTKPDGDFIHHLGS